MVIQAQIKPRRGSSGDRSDVRRKVRLVATGKNLRGQAGQVSIHDLSSGGLLLQTEVPLAIGEVVEVELPRTGTQRVEIVWSSGSFFGGRFLTPVSPAAISAALLRSTPETAAQADQDLSNMSSGFGERLAKLREERGWMLEALAERLGVTRQAVWYWETGQRLPRAGHLATIAEVFEVSEHDLLAPSVATTSTDHAAIVNQLRREIAQLNGVAEAQVRVVIEF